MLFLNFGLTSTPCAVQFFRPAKIQGEIEKAWNGQSEQDRCNCVIGAALRSGCSPKVQIQCYTERDLVGRWKESKMGAVSVWTVDANGNGKRVGSSFTDPSFNDMAVSLTMKYKEYGSRTTVFCNQITARFYWNNGLGGEGLARAVIINPNLIRFTSWLGDKNQGYYWVRVDN